MIEIKLFFGIIGASLILIAFILNQIHRWKDNNFFYDLVNFIGGFFLVIYAIFLKSPPFIFLNMIWTLVSLRDIFTDIKQGCPRSKKFL
jgi:hypothetical protein